MQFNTSHEEESGRANFKFLKGDRRNRRPRYAVKVAAIRRACPRCCMSKPLAHGLLAAQGQPSRIDDVRAESAPSELKRRDPADTASSPRPAQRIHSLTERRGPRLSAFLPNARVLAPAAELARAAGAREPDRRAMAAVRPRSRDVGQFEPPSKQEVTAPYFRS
jgi:hypothetical protein